jgi:hypothetical protein
MSARVLAAKERSGKMENAFWILNGDDTDWNGYEFVHKGKRYTVYAAGMMDRNEWLCLGEDGFSYTASHEHILLRYAENLTSRYMRLEATLAAIKKRLKLD